MKYPELFKPFKINQLEIKNRICMAPMDTKRDAANNSLSDDTIVIATGLRPNQRLYEELTGKMDAAHVYNIGDSRKVGTVMTAVQMAKQAADAIG